MSTFKVIPDIFELRPEHVRKYYILVFKGDVSEVGIPGDICYIYTCIVWIGLLCRSKGAPIITDKSEIHLIFISRYILCQQYEEPPHIKPNNLLCAVRILIPSQSIMKSGAPREKN